MLKTIRTIATLAVAGALLALPATALAAKGGQGKAQNCAKTSTRGYQVGGTLVSATADDPATPLDNEATVTLTVTSANRHARNSGEIADQDATRKGVQVKGATYTVPTTDVFTLTLNGYDEPDTPSVGDKVKVNGRIALTKKRCAPDGTSTADRYATPPDVRRVTISDRDADA
jgi:hypothetical protein